MNREKFHINSIFAEPLFKSHAHVPLASQPAQLHGEGWRMESAGAQIYARRRTNTPRMNRLEARKRHSDRDLFDPEHSAQIDPAAREAITHAGRSPGRPATLWIRVVSMASARAIAGRMVVRRRDRWAEEDIMTAFRLSS
jgi:hypothetical protein